MKVTWRLAASLAVFCGACASDGDDVTTDSGMQDGGVPEGGEPDAAEDGGEDAGDAAEDGGEDAGEDAGDDGGDDAGPVAAFTLQLLHFADIDSNEATALGNLDDFSALVDGFRNDATYGDHTLVVSSGDNMIPGPRWFAAENTAVRSLTGSNEPGHVDTFWLNELGVAASALGNHDLDQGPGEFAGAIAPESYDPGTGVVDFPGATFPYLAANVDFSLEGDLSVGTDGEPAADLAGMVAGTAVVTVDGETLGLVGVSTPELPAITTTGALTIEGSVTDIAMLAAAVQPSIDALVAADVDKIIVLSHLQQIAFDKALAEQLSGVDVIVAGGSNTRMGDDTDALYPGDAAFAETYPYATTDADGEPILIVNTDADYKYLGRLVVSFDEDGVVIPSSVDPAVSGAWASTADNVATSGGTPIASMVAVRDAVQGVIESQYENVIGHTDVFLDGRREQVRTEETNLGNLTSDSMRWYVQQCDGFGATPVLALKNGGGIRAEIGDVVVIGSDTMLDPPSNAGLAVDPGDVSEGHLRGTLRFDNGLVVLDVTAAELKMLLEHGVAGTEPGSTPGQFPQVGGISFSFDITETAQELDDTGAVMTPGTRVRDLWVDTDADGAPDTALYTAGTATADGMAATVYKLVTLNFLANGGDNYPFAQLSAPNRSQVYEGVGFGDPDEAPVDTPDFTVLSNCDPGMQSSFSSTGGEQDALAEYMLEFHADMASAFDTAETGAESDLRIQNLGVAAGFTAPN